MAKGSLYNKASPMGDEVFYQKPFRDMIESHLEWLKSHPNAQIIDISPNVALRYQGDFFGLMSNLEIQPYMAWIYMRMNELTSPMDYDHSMLNLLTIPENVIQNLRRKFVTLTDVS